MSPRAAIVVAVAWAMASPARAMDAFQPDAVVELPEAFVPDDGVALEQLGYRLVVRPESWRQKIGTGLKPLGGAGRAITIIPPLDPTSRASAAAYALRGRCRLVVHAEPGFDANSAARLSSLGPCFFDVRVGADPEPIAPILSRLKPATIVWEAGATLPQAPALAKFAQLPQPTLGVDASAAEAALGLAAQLGDRSLALRVHVERGVLSPGLLRALRKPSRGSRVTIVAHKGLDPVAARLLRTLPRVDLEIALENGVPPGLVAAAQIFARPIDPLDQRPVSDADADSPLLSIPAAP